MPPAAERVFHTPELLEMILWSLITSHSKQEVVHSHRALLLARTTCLTWHNLLETSSRLRRYLWLPRLRPETNATQTRSADQPEAIDHFFLEINPWTDYCLPKILTYEHCQYKPRHFPHVRRYATIYVFAVRRAFKRCFEGIADEAQEEAFCPRWPASGGSSNMLLIRPRQQNLQYQCCIHRMSGIDLEDPDIIWRRHGECTMGDLVDAVREPLNGVWERSKEEDVFVTIRIPKED